MTYFVLSAKLLTKIGMAAFIMLHYGFNIKLGLRYFAIPAIVLSNFRHLLVSTGTQISHARGIVGHTTMTEFHIIEIDMIDLPYDITTHEAAILGGCHDIVEVDAAHLAAASVGLTLGEAPVGVFVVAVSPRVAGHIDGFSLAPPHVAPQLQVHDDIGEHHVGHGALITVLYAQATVGTRDDAVVKAHIIDRVHILRPYLDGTRTRGHRAIGHHNVVAWAVLGIFAPVLQADAVIT